jgi:hypothetical protein
MHTPAESTVRRRQVGWNEKEACVECVSALRDVSSHRRPTGRPAACPRRLRARDEDGWTGAAPLTVTSPGVPERNERT